MPHSFDHKVETRVNETSNQQVTVDELEVGPAEDEIWDILDIVWQVSAQYANEDTAPTVLEGWTQLDVGDSLLLDGNDLANGIAEPVDSQRVIDGGFFYANQLHVDDGNNQTSQASNVPYKADLAFSPGDLRLEFPGTLQTRWAINQDAAQSVFVNSKLSVYYRPESRHG